MLGVNASARSERPGDGLRVGLVGCGGWGRHVLRDLVALGGEVEVVARSAESRERAEAGGAARIAGTIGELGRVDGVVCATPETLHAATVARALELGVPVFSEKPLTVDPASASRLAEAAPERLFVMDKWRYHPGVEALRDLAASGELGAVHALALKRLGWGVRHPTSDAIWHLCPHDVSIALEILGSIPGPRFAVAERQGAMTTGLNAALGADPWVAIEASIAYPKHHREVRVVFEDGIAVLESPMAEAIKVAPADALGGEVEERPIGDELPLERELAAFLEHLRGGPPPRSSAAEGAAIVEAVGALRELAGLPRASPEESDPDAGALSIG